MYRMNVDIPTGTILVHRAETEDRRCRTRFKNPRDGYWKMVAISEQVEAESFGTGLKITLCPICKPVLRGRSGDGD